jgi:phosphoglycolate phosphatase
MHLFFDLDGTLTDSAPGIVRCINHALVALARPPWSETRLQPMIGTPLTAIFGVVLGSDDPRLLDAAVDHYRRRFDRVGIFENALYPGVVEALDELRRAGHQLQVVTAKPVPAARRVLDHFDIGGRFAAVHGPALTDRGCDKADFVAAALETAQAHPETAVMIGDRVDDVRAARRHGVRAVAAGWGYGCHEELLAAGPEYLAPSIAHLLEWLRGGLSHDVPRLLRGQGRGQEA